MKITKRQLRQIINEELAEQYTRGYHDRDAWTSGLTEQDCADTDDGCVREDDDGTWYILNNKKGGVWRKGFESKQSAKDSLEAMHSQKESLTRQNLRQIIMESLEDRLSVDPEDDRSGWEVIPDDELHGALSGAIYDLYKYVNGIRPRWVNFKEMSVPELEAMHHRLSLELKDMQRDDAFSAGLDAAAASAAEEEAADIEATHSEHPYEQLPSHQGMGRHPLVGPARDVRRGRKISEEAETFAGAVRMAQVPGGCFSPMESRVDPEFARLIKKGY